MGVPQTVLKQTIQILELHIMTGGQPYLKFGVLRHFQQYLSHMETIKGDKSAEFCLAEFKLRPGDLKSGVLTAG